MRNNKYDDIKIPLNINSRIDDGVKKALIKKKEKKENKNKIAGIIVASISLTIIFGISNPTFAKEIPIIGNVFKVIEEMIYSPVKYSKYATDINETVSSGGINITLSEAASDGRYVYATYVIESETPFKFTENEDEQYSNAYQIFLKTDNKPDLTGPNINISGLACLQGKFIDEYTFIGVQRYDLKPISREVPDEFNFKTEIIAIENYNPKKYGTRNIDDTYVIKGNWTFDVPIKVDKTLTSITELSYFEESGIEGISIAKTPFDMIINVDYNKFKIPHFNLEVYDEDGEILFARSGGGGDNNREYTFELPKKESNKIRISIEKMGYESDENNDTKAVLEEVVYDKVINLK